MLNLFLRFPDEGIWRDYAKANNVLQIVEVPVIDGDGNPVLDKDENEVMETVENWVLSTHDYAISNIGILYNDDAVINDQTGEITTPATPKPGWHVNWKADAFPPGITAYEVMPDEVCRVWAGDPVSKADREKERANTTAVFAVDS